MQDDESLPSASALRDASVVAKSWPFSWVTFIAAWPKAPQKWSRAPERVVSVYLSAIPASRANTAKLSPLARYTWNSEPPCTGPNCASGTPSRPCSTNLGGPANRLIGRTKSTALPCMSRISIGSRPNGCNGTCNRHSESLGTTRSALRYGPAARLYPKPSVMRPLFASGGWSDAPVLPAAANTRSASSCSTALQPEVAKLLVCLRPAVASKPAAGLLEASA
mmetsp:Transcript_59766/g.192353  ORF Transcript_59766/g.192353 Transcript_59766/m.192353 type:complete len:222 (-) Transcript_59766:1007-1672(-)